MIRLFQAADRGICKDLHPNIRWNYGNPTEEGKTVGTREDGRYQENTSNTIS